MAAHGGSAASSALKGLIQQFTAITGASESVGKHMLEACNNNLEMAVTMFLDGGGIAEEPSTSSASVSTVRPHTEEEVRAPIPQKQEILVEPEPLFGAPKRRRPARSIFDGFRDFQTETIRQEQELRNGGAIDKKLTTLADLFRPPIDLMHKGSFETAKECGQMQNKWLMINIQNVQDFACQCLNRDVWSNEAVKNIIREHFIFWQVYHDSEEGQRYIQFYKLGDFPYVSILDPRTGQKLVEWHQLDVSSFLDQVTGFLGEHGQLDGLSSSPPKKCARSESLIDASEDSQLEAAIRASLQETHFDSTQTKQDSRSDEESESELFSGSEEFISVCGSDEEEEIENLAKSRKSPHKDLGHRKEENRRPLTEPPARTEPGTTTNHQGLPAVDSEILEMSPEKSDGIIEGIDVNGPKAQLMLRYPDGKREQITLPEQAKLLALVKHVQSKGYPNERFELLTNFPRRKLSHLDYDITLQEVLIAAIFISLKGWRYGCFSRSGPCQSMLTVLLSSGLAFLGAFICFITSGGALKYGPFCMFHDVSPFNQTQTWKYGYPFKDLHNRNYLYDRSLWNSVCLEPSKAVIWHVSFFSSLLCISLLQIFLVIIHFINSFLGLFCSFCKESGPPR
ncbi:PREDICTED: UBX domain-containing protein 7 isoform X2 [Condylura cristata]|uniref:UBX domain-containing protein 7 isoform X2 n=1 Tax=Condylura cristata TaxID=143302 RepID=UPI000643C7EA|nr:PREDICTED: UBX domain-containing protein 7 isoform X2 [Condylura cristata]